MTPARKSEVIELPSDCSLRNLGPLRNQLCNVAADVETLTLDLRQVERFDTATLQLLVACARDRAARGAKLLMFGNRPAWDEAAALLGLTAALTGGM